MHGSITSALNKEIRNNKRTPRGIQVTNLKNVTLEADVDEECVNCGKDQKTW